MDNGVRKMKAYIQTDSNGIPDYDHFNAYHGFSQMGFETIFFNTYEQINKSEKQDIIVGFSGPVKVRLRDFGIEIPNIDYPKSIQKYLGRNIRKTTLNTVSNDPEMWNVFIKPINNKSFSGRVVRSAHDLIGCSSGGEDQEVYISELLDFVSEYRVFVRYGQILDIRHYYGRWDIFPNAEIIKNCIKDYYDAPNAYAIDFGVTSDGGTYLIEVNASGSIGSYGLEPIVYAKFMSARWSELTGTQDECAFDIL